VDEVGGGGREIFIFLFIENKEDKKEKVLV